MPKSKPDDANNTGVYNEQINPNTKGWPEVLRARGQEPTEGFELAYGYGGESPLTAQMGEKSLPNSAPQTFVTDNYKPSAKSAPGRTGSGGE